MTAGAGALVDRVRAIGDGLWRLRAGLGRPWRGLRRKMPARLLIAPQELEPGDPAIALDMYAGQFLLAGRSVQVRGQSPFTVAPPPAAWLHELHGFAWLRHFRESDAALIRQYARALVDDWLGDRAARRHAAACLPEVMASRMMAFLVNSPLLLTGADHAFYLRFLKALAGLAADLEPVARRRALGPVRLAAAISLAAYVLCALSEEKPMRRATRLLEEALDETVLADGCPLDRNPQRAIELASLLLPLRTAYVARGRAVPPAVQGAIERLLRFIRLLRHPSGDMALFNGMGASRFDLIGTIMDFDDAREEPNAEAGGYQRFSRGGTVVIADTGAAVAHRLSGRLHASALAFEMSAGHEKIVTGCGAGPAGLGDLCEALRETAAHSTLAFDGVSELEFQPSRRPDGSDERLAMTPPRTIPPQREADVDGDRLTMAAEGYRRRFGLLHRRKLSLSADGGHLAGIDWLEPAGRAATAPPQAYLRFHLSPRVSTDLQQGDTMVQLGLPDGAVWSFEAGGRMLRLEESIYLGGLASQRRSRQIVVAMDGEEIAWSFVCRRPGV